MSTTDGFPCELLHAPPQARLASFVGKVVAHPRLKEAHEAVMRALHAPIRPPLVLVFGPTGVGKTTLRLRVEQRLIEEALPGLQQEPGRVPVVAMEAVAPESGQFHWKDYYTRALVALDEPLIQHKAADAAWGIRHDATGRVVVERGTPGPELRRALEQCLRYRGLTAFIVDEAQHLQKMASGRRLLDQMDTLKSLAALTGTVHVLVGTYELLGLANLSAQLSRRCVEIHFVRYRAERAEDVLAFKSVLLTFQRALPLVSEPDLVGRWEYLYERSVGCVGVLKDWLNRALAAALEAGAATLTVEHLEQQAVPSRRLLSLAREIAEGEQALTESDRERNEVRRLLGLGAEPPAGRASEAPGKATPARHPVARRPTRDPVGAGEAAHGQ